MPTTDASGEPATAAELRSCRYLELGALSEPDVNQLRIVVREQVAYGPEQDFDVGAGSIPGVRAVGHIEGCRVFELSWPFYVAYSVRNESFVGYTDEDVPSGQPLVYAQSQYLEFVARATIACDAHPGPLKHWRLGCQDHIIDVVSTDEPTIRLLERATTSPDAASVHHFVKSAR